MEPHELLELIEGHIRQTNGNETKFGVDALNDPNFVRDLRGGREPRRSTVRAVIAFIATGQPRANPASEAA